MSNDDKDDQAPTLSHYEQQARELEYLVNREGLSQRAKNAMNAAAYDLRQLERELAETKALIKTQAAQIVQMSPRLGADVPRDEAQRPSLAAPVLTVKMAAVFENLNLTGADEDDYTHLVEKWQSHWIALWDAMHHERTAI